MTGTVGGPGRGPLTLENTCPVDQAHPRSGLEVRAHAVRVARVWPLVAISMNRCKGERMHAMRSRVVLALVAALTSGGCQGDEGRAAAEAGASPARPAEEVPVAPPPPPPAPLTAEDSARVRDRIAAWSDSVRASFERVESLRAREVAELRRDRNAEQVATAESLGLRVSGAGDMEALRRQGRLVPLGDSTSYWVLREMEHSVPLVTPDTRAMLEELGRRFHARLDRLGLPRYRMKVTSALRTDETQSDLRRTNSYASRTVSAHEFGTTVDVSHERFAVPTRPRPGPVPGAPELPAVEAEMLEEAGKEHAKALQAELGRAIAEMRDEGLLRVMMENMQPVYHMTVARRFPAAS